VNRESHGFKPWEDVNSHFRARARMTVEVFRDPAARRMATSLVS